MARYRKKPVVIEAITFDELVEYEKSLHNPWRDPPWWFYYNDHVVQHARGDCYVITTPEGVSEMTPADMLITGVQGEIYPCKRDIFDQTYVPVSPLSEEDEE